MTNLNYFKSLSHCTKTINTPVVSSENEVDTKVCQTKALTKIRNHQCFDAIDSDGIWKISIKEYVPLVCVALHDGSGFPFELEQHCLLGSEDRIFEEDPHTAKLVVSQPIVLSGMDSRYFYDLNRAPEHCDQTTVFGRRIWEKDIHPLSSLAKQRHEKFYALFNVLVDKLVELFGYCLIIDIHSYNYSRIDRETPLFNLGTAKFKREEEHLFACQFKHVLADIKFPGVKLTMAENDVFWGKGYLLEWVQREFPKTCLTIPIDIKKIYCDEASGRIYPLQFRRLTQELNKAIHSASVIFKERHLP
jgi:hypothetical protein